MIKYFRKKFSKLYKKNVKQRFDVLREIYDNRRSAVKKKEVDMCQSLFILGSAEEVKYKARFWQNNEEEEKFIQNALLEWEYMLCSNQKERELIKRGVMLRQEFFEDCVKFVKNKEVN